MGKDTGKDASKVNCRAKPRLSVPASVGFAANWAYPLFPAPVSETGHQS